LLLKLKINKQNSKV